MSDGLQSPWRQTLRERMRGQPVPMLVLPDSLWSAASLWAGTRAWLSAFRGAGLGAGDRLVCALPQGAAFVQVLLACLWEEIVFAPVSLPCDVHAMMCALDARAAVASSHTGSLPLASVFIPDEAAQPPDERPALRIVTVPPTAGVALLLAVCDSDQRSRWVEVSNGQLTSAMNARRAVTSLVGARVLSVQPWWQERGLIHGLLLPLLDADEIVIAAGDGLDIEAIAVAMREHLITHVDGDPCALPSR